ncbi:MAG: lipocalin family protein [Candidatus Thiodiazotropha sp. L084R]
MSDLIVNLKPLVLITLFTFTVVVFVFAKDLQEMETVSQVDLNLYQGSWYEIARLPNRFQDQCAGNVTANYKQLDDGNIEVINRCLDDQGRMDEAQGVARIINKSTNAKLEVSFVSLFGWNLFWGDYWIIGLGDSYEYAVIGTPNRSYAWVLSRSDHVIPEQWQLIQQVLLQSGYDPNELVMTKHRLVGHAVNKVTIRAPLISQGKACSAGNGKPFPRSTTQH